MQQEPYLKCPCENCGAHIDFPAAGLGQSIGCPGAWKKFAHALLQTNEALYID